MRILFLSKYALNPNYGQPTRQFFYSKYLSRIDRNEVWLISSRSTVSTKIPKFRGLSKDETFGPLTNSILNGPTTSIGFSLKRIWSWLWFEIQVLRLFPRLRAWKPDVIIVSSLSILTFATGVFLKWMLRRPLIVEVRDVYPATLVEVGGLSKWNPFVWLLRQVERFGYRHADMIFSSLANLEPHVAEAIGQQKPVAYLPMGYDPEFYEQSSDLSPAGRIAEQRLKELQGKFLIGYAGTIGKANALQCPLDVFRDFTESNPNLAFVLLGDGPLLDSYRETYSRFNNIVFLGRVDKSDLGKLLSMMDVVINPWLDLSIYRFGISPNKWIDYMQAKKPILAPFGGYQQVLETVNCGWFVKPEDPAALHSSIETIAKLPKEELRKMGDNGYRYMTAELSYATLGVKMFGHIERVVNASAR
ncbi:MAG: glycosyltransferase family 4 protein [Planctomycetaceae bacterium]|nr:glycosyltransferase family 4 protein [Planctomycetaceae bacterium]